MAFLAGFGNEVGEQVNGMKEFDVFFNNRLGFFPPRYGWLGFLWIWEFKDGKWIQRKGLGCFPGQGKG